MSQPEKADRPGMMDADLTTSTPSTETAHQAKGGLASGPLGGPKDNDDAASDTSKTAAKKSRDEAKALENAAAIERAEAAKKSREEAKSRKARIAALLADLKAQPKMTRIAVTLRKDDKEDTVTGLLVECDDEGPWVAWDKDQEKSSIHLTTSLYVPEGDILGVQFTPPQQPKPKQRKVARPPDDEDDDDVSVLSKASPKKAPQKPPTKTTARPTSSVTKLPSARSKPDSDDDEVDAPTLIPKKKPQQRPREEVNCDDENDEQMKQALKASRLEYLQSLPQNPYAHLYQFPHLMGIPPAPNFPPQQPHARTATFPPPPAQPQTTLNPVNNALQLHMNPFSEDFAETLLTHSNRRTVALTAELRVPAAVDAPWIVLYPHLLWGKDATVWLQQWKALLDHYAVSFKISHFRDEYELHRDTLITLSGGPLPASKPDWKIAFGHTAAIVRLMVVVLSGATVAETARVSMSDQWREGRIDFEKILDAAERKSKTESSNSDTAVAQAKNFDKLFQDQQAKMDKILKQQQQFQQQQQAQAAAARRQPKYFRGGGRRH